MKPTPPLLSPVYNRGIPTADFLDKLTTWLKDADEEIFSTGYKGKEADIYDKIQLHRPGIAGEDRRALMGEVLRVLAGYESSWDWREGRDVTNPSSNTPATEEAGAFQCSANSCNFDSSLVACFNRHAAISGRPRWVSMNVSGGDFIRMSKDSPDYAMEHCARLLRFTIRHHGPILRAEIFQWMRPTAVQTFKELTQGPEEYLGSIGDLREVASEAAMVSADLVDLFADVGVA